MTAALERAPDQAGEVFPVRFHLGGRNWPSNPWRLQGPGQLVVEADFVTVRGSSHRSFRFPKREEQRVRMVDIVNVRIEGDDVIFDVLGVERTEELGFTAPDGATANRIAALLPRRQTEAFAQEYAEREAFHDRIDYWSPSTPVLWCLLAANVAIYVLMWMERTIPGPLPHGHFPGWNSLQAAHVHLDLLATRAAILAQLLASPSTWWPLAQSLLGLAPSPDPGLLTDQFVQWGSNMPIVTAGAHQWWRLAASMFLHGNVIHLALNMFALWQVGQLVERIFGSARFLGLYMLAGLSGSLASLTWHLLSNPGTNSLGASGAVFGIIGGLLAFIGRKDSGVPPTIVQNLRGSIFPFLAFNIVAGFAYPHVDNAAHLGGLVGGWLAGHLLARSLIVPGQRAG